MTFLSLQVKGVHRKQTLALLCTVSFILLLLLFYRLNLYHTNRQSSLDLHEQDLPAIWPGQLDTATHQRQSLYTPSMFIPTALQHNHFLPITAVILRTHQDQGIHHIVKYLHKYPFIKELYIYNLVTSHPLAGLTFEQPNHWLLHKVDITVIEETELGHDGIMALFSTCALATHGYCYIQEDVSLNLHLDTLYTQFMRYPDLIHVNTRSEEYITHRRWQLYNQDGSIHTGYANLRHGAIIPRKQAQLFMNQVAVQKILSYQNPSADVLFSLWANSYPYIVSNPLFLDADQVTPYRQMFNALEYLKNALADQSPYFVGSNDIHPPLDQRDVRAACENDKCLFVTNLDPFLLSTEYDPNQNLTNNSIESFTWGLDMDIPDSEFWLHRGYHAAVDGDSGTCWNTYQVPKEGDYFGLDLVGNMRASRLLIYLRQPMEHQDPFKIRGLNKDGWVDCPVTLDHTQSLPRRLVFQMQCDSGNPISAIRLFFAQNHKHPFDLCGLGLDNFII